MKKYSIILLTMLILFGTGIVSAANEIKIGALIDNSGESASYAEGIEAAIDLAVSDLNDSYELAGMDTRVIVIKAYVDGTKEGAIKGTEDLLADGGQIIVGPYSSEEVAGILPLLTKKEILSINPSTSVELSKQGDPVIRLAPSDARLYQALIAYNNAAADKIPMKGVILARDDVYGGTLAETMKDKSFISLSVENLQENGVEEQNVTETLLYAPNTKDFTKTLNELSSLVTPLIDEYGENNVIILVVSFDEIADILAQASEYPVLYKVRWQGTDSVALNPAILSNATAAGFAVDTGLTAHSFNIIQPKDTDYWRVYDAIKAANDGHQPSIYEILPYDETLMAAWIMQSNPSTLEDMLYIADSFGKLSYGATGWLKLNSRGDRQFGDYFFYQVQKGEDETYSWIPVSMYLDETNSLVPLKNTNNTFMQHYSSGTVQ
jgi:branched-chain amino acid transport system substrate-binding protein